MAKYSKTAQKKVERALHEKKKGTLKSGGSGKKVTSRKQAIAIGLSEAREKGAKVPPPKKSAKKAAKKTTKKTGGRPAKKATKKTAKKTSR
jgi:hypothetical protein